MVHSQTNHSDSIKMSRREIARHQTRGYCCGWKPENMQLLVIRHGIAQDQQEFAKSGRVDALRPLTRPGKKKMRAGARGLKKVVPKVTVLASSPLTRAVQTARIVGAKYDIKPLTIASLSPRKPFSQL